MQDSERRFGESLSGSGICEEVHKGADLEYQAIIRVAAADADPDHRPLFFGEALGAKAYAMFRDINADDIPDCELFE